MLQGTLWNFNTDFVLKFPKFLTAMATISWNALLSWNVV